MTSPPPPPPLPWEGQPYSAKRHGTSLASCDAEPVQTPGCIQAHGALLVLRRADLTVLQASENVGDWLGASAQSLLGQPLSTAVSEPAAARIGELLGSEPLENNPLYVLTLPARGATPGLDVVVHVADEVVVVELEACREEGKSEADHYALVKKSVGRLQATSTLRAFCRTVCEEICALTGFDRVMVYRFHEDAHGEVFAESKRGDLDPWLGLHYPAEDIPAPAREVFKQIWIRPTPDVGSALFELVPLANPDTGKALRMTHCALRGASVMYTEYLQNMGVRAGLTLAIRREGELWGLIACHHYAGPLFVPYQARAACELFAQVVSLQHRAAEDREQLHYRLAIEAAHQALVAAAAREGRLAALTEGSPTLLDGIAAGGVALYHGRSWSRVGNTPSEVDLGALRDWLFARREIDPRGRLAYATDALSRDYPAGEAFADVASGVLAVPLSVATESLLLWFRPETIQTVRWGGNPHDKPTVPGPHGDRLTPRKSFALFVESVRQRSLPWKGVEIDAAIRLRRQLVEVVVDQAERLAEVNADLIRSNEDLDAFAYVASHDLKEPLRGIHKYAHQLREDAAVASDEGHRKKLDGLIRLTLRMDGLLESLLHLSRVGRAPLSLDAVDLGEVLEEALDMVHARRAERPTDIVVPRPLPTVRGDRMQIREVLVNLLANAMKYSDRPHRRIEVGYLAPGEAGSRGDAPAEASGLTVLHVRDDGIGIQPRHLAQVFRMFRRLHGRDEYGGGTGAGLTIVKKLIERHGGQIWIDSTPGQGTTFHFTLEGPPS